MRSVPRKATPCFSDLPETYTDAVLSVEDHRFYGHIGIDPIAITRAIVNDVKAGCFVEGGSTITQQLAKKSVLHPGKEDGTEGGRGIYGLCTGTGLH